MKRGYHGRRRDSAGSALSFSARCCGNGASCSQKQPLRVGGGDRGNKHMPCVTAGFLKM